MNTKNALLISSLILATNVAHAQDSENQVHEINPVDNNIGGITYEKSLQIIEKERTVQYGEPIGILIHKNEGCVDIFSLDSIVIRVPLDKLLSQPNRTGPDQYK